MQLAPFRSLSSVLLSFVRIDQKLMDFANIRRWPLDCDEMHHETCAAPDRIGRLQAATPIILIDVHNYCLI